MFGGLLAWREILLTDNKMDWFLTAQWNIICKELSSSVGLLAILRSVSTHSVISGHLTSPHWKFLFPRHSGGSEYDFKIRKPSSLGIIPTMQQLTFSWINISNKQNKRTKVDTIHAGIWGISPLLNADSHRNYANLDGVWWGVHVKSWSNSHCHKWQEYFASVLKIVRPQSHCHLFIGKVEIFGRKQVPSCSKPKKKKSLKLRHFLKEWLWVHIYSRNTDKPAHESVSSHAHCC